MRDTLPTKPYKKECAVVNLASIRSGGSHWVAYKKSGNIIYYFDSFGQLPPPKEVQTYFNNCEILYNYYRHQSFNSFNCGHLCLEFLLFNNNNK